MIDNSAALIFLALIILSAVAILAGTLKETA